MEWDYGHYDGKTTAEIRQENPGLVTFPRRLSGR